MKAKLVSIAAIGALALCTGAYAADDMAQMDMSGGAQHSATANDEMSHGEVKKVDTAAGKLTIKHGPLKNLGMGAMTMVFKAANPAMLAQLNVGDKIDFVAEEVNGALTVVKLQKR